MDPNTSHLASHPVAVRVQCNSFPPLLNSLGIIHASNTCGLLEYHDSKGTYYSTSVAYYF